MPPVNQQREPALPPAMTIPFSYALRRRVSMPCAFQIAIMLRVLPPPTTMASMLRIVSSKDFCSGEELIKVRRTKGCMGKSAQISYQWIIPFGLSAFAVGIMQIRGLVLWVNEMMYLINGAPM